MRITNRMMTDHAIQQMNTNLERLNAYNERASSGKAFQNASDDPITVSLALNLRSSLRTSQAYRDTAQQAGQWISANDFALQKMQGLASRAQGLILRGLNDTLSSSERVAALASEMDGIIQSLTDLANTQHNGEYIFSGFLLKTATITRPDRDTIVSQDDGSQIERAIAPGQSVTVNVNGSVFVPLLNSLVAARNHLEQGQMDALRNDLIPFEQAFETLNVTTTENGARLRQVEATLGYLDQMDIEVKSLLTQKEEVNMAEAISMLRAQQTTYQAVLEVSQRAISALSLFDYLR
jgi:flagellar hook-associated protein 3 FlgL